ncbi:thiamine phosphate synthase [Hyphomicrobium methylovorum]|uniref:thiamine phosphate synthase n=1 Tax=Hyphomicrobium methylovorum TaxID=84 RepID=UPI0015E7A94A|nr:thiamine phosphate synthase [Hyphomicrobium methylovorum]
MSSHPLRLPRFYPIVPDADWLGRIVPLGVKLVQLRMKDATPGDVARETRRSLAICAEHGCQFVLNDYWAVAIDEGVDFIHLGQEDLASADLAAIRARGIRIGISTHDDAELATALAARPDYVALGPIYETKLKVMPWAPQGLDKLASWRTRVGSLPLVAIGGLTPERAPAVATAGADSLAVITDFVTAADPIARVREWVNWARN